MTAREMQNARRIAAKCGLTVEEYLKVTRQLLRGNVAVYRQKVTAVLHPDL